MAHTAGGSAMFQTVSGVCNCLQLGGGGAQRTSLDQPVECQQITGVRHIELCAVPPLQVVQFIRAACELHSRELVLVVRQNGNLRYNKIISV